MVERGKAVTEWLVAESTSVDSVPGARLLMAAAAGVFSGACLEGIGGWNEDEVADGSDEQPDSKAVQLSH